MKLHTKQQLALPVLAAFAVALAGLVAPDLAQAAPKCGDNKLNQPLEECDGHDADACLGKCLADCTCAPMCGDDTVNLPEEQCDGIDDDACPGECLPSCTCDLEPRVFALEAELLLVKRALCEHLFALGIDFGLATFCQGFRFPPSKTIFVTGGGVNGGQIMGLAGADSICQSSAGLGGLSGTYRAWLSSSLVNARDRLTQHPGPYRLPTGQIVAVSFADLVDGTLLHGINVTESGGVPPTVRVWTATTPSGLTSSASTCFDWFSVVGDGDAGTALHTNFFWTQTSPQPCDESLPLYCLEQ